MVLAGVMAISRCALLVNLDVLDGVRFPEWRADLRKVLALLGVSTVAGLLIMGLLKTLERE